MILAAGEALIDLVKQPNAELFSAHVGGAPLNAAIALGRLDVPVRFACPISDDHFGDMIRARLTASQVGLAAPEPVNFPSPLAVVTLDEAAIPTYQFYRDGTADRQIDKPFIAQCLNEAVSVLHIGGTCLTSPVDFEKWMMLVKGAKASGALISLDPNIRPSLVKDSAAHLEQMMAVFEQADLIKASDEDCMTLFGHADLERLAAGPPTAGPFNNAKLVIMTRGAAGASARLHSGEIVSVPSQKLSDIRDTVGAGDCFQAGLLATLWRDGALASTEALVNVSAKTVHSAITIGHIAAGINCTRNGCDPAWLSEIRAANIPA